MSPSVLVGEVLALCRLRGAPEKLPHSPRLLGALFVAGSGVDALTGLAIGSSDALAHALLGNAVVFGLCALALAIRRLSNRIVQTATALLGCGLVISLLQLPVALAIGPLPSGADGTPSLSPVAALLSWALLGLLAWQVLVFARIVRSAMESTMPFALALVMTWVVAVWALDGVLFGA